MRVEMSYSFADKLAQWAESQPQVKALVLIGSHVRAAGAVNHADTESDWDFQLLTSDLSFWRRRDWVEKLGCGQPLAYSFRPTFGGVNKVTFILPGRIEVDLVILAAGPLVGARIAVGLGLHRRLAGVRKGLGLLAVVIRPGYRFLKGAEKFGALYRQVVEEVNDPRLGDSEAVELAEGFVCDLVWQRRKLARGEFLAAQRMLHRELLETNFRLWHEFRLRKGLESFPEARRIELVATAGEQLAVTGAARPNRTELAAATDAAWVTLRQLMGELVPTWRAPELDE